MKPIRYTALLAAFLPLTVLSFNVHADLSYSGQLQQELVSWSSPAPLEDGFEIRDGGQHQQASHDVEGASYLALLSTFYLTPNHQGLARFHFDLSQTEGLEHYEAYLGLQGSSSNWRIGTISSPYKSSTAGWDPFLATFMQARGNGGASIYHNGYVESAINYQSEWWSTDVALQWSPENGSSLSLAYQLNKWDFALANIIDKSGAVQNSATKLGLRYRSGEWTSTFQYESLKNGSTPAQVSYFNLAKQNGKTEYGLSLGIYRSDNIADTDLNYVALGMKHALAKNNIIHFGYRMSSAPEDGSQSEKAVGLGFRYSF